jgi:hypothetical protein
MNTYRVTGLRGLSDQVGMPLGGLADHEKGGTGPMSVQQVKNAGRRFRVRPVVERQGGDRLPRRNMGYRPGQTGRDEIQNTHRFIF